MGRTRWEGLDNMANRINVYERRIMQIIKQVAQEWQGILEPYMKENAPWDDQSGNARQTLHAFVEELSNDTVRLYLAHGVEYGLHLETRFAGRYAIIWPTIQRHLEPIRQMLQNIFR